MYKYADLSRRALAKLKPLGYWQSRDEPSLPHPREFVDTSWDESEKELVAEYMDNAYMAKEWCGLSPCRMCKKFDNGFLDLTDGVWIFPEGLSHYVRKHSVKPPEKFLAHVRSNNYKVQVMKEYDPTSTFSRFKRQWPIWVGLLAIAIVLAVAAWFIAKSLPFLPN